MSEWEQEDRERRQIFFQIAVEVVRFLAQVSTPLLLLLILLKMH